MKIYCENPDLTLKANVESCQVVLVLDGDWGFKTLQDTLCEIFNSVGGFDKDSIEIVRQASLEDLKKRLNQDAEELPDEYLETHWKDDSDWELRIEKENSRSGLKLTVNFFSKRREFLFLFFKKEDVASVVELILTSDPKEADSNIASLLEPFSCSFIFQAAQRAVQSI